jgi:adenylosuccinate synthase
MNHLEKVDICCGLAWGDEAKGKIVAQLSKEGNYDYVCRWAGGNNAGHTIYIDTKKYKTHLIPSGVFYNIKSIIGPDCVINEEGFQKEIDYLKKNGFNTELIKVSPKAHVVQDKHIEDDIKNYFKTQGTTAKGIAPCYRDKFARVGIRAEEVDFFKPYLWDEKLNGNVLCEGAQGFWLDINYGNYPYITSSTTLPYGACSLGFPAQLIKNVFGAVKIYDTRSGLDPDFPEELLLDEELLKVANEGREYGVTTGRRRKVNWLNVDKLIKAIQISGTTDLIISKIDVLEKVNLYKLIYNKQIENFNNMSEMKNRINNLLYSNCIFISRILYSNDPEKVENLLKTSS